MNLNFGYWYNHALGKIDDRGAKIDNGVDFRIGNNSILVLKKGCNIRRGTFIHLGNGAYCEIGKNTHITYYNMISCGDFIKIGDNCKFGEFSSFHDYDHGKVGLGIKKSSPIVIGKGVWGGCKCTYLKGIKIGNNAVIGANTLVAKNVPSGKIFFNQRRNIAK